VKTIKERIRSSYKDILKQNDKEIISIFERNLNYLENTDKTCGPKSHYPKMIKEIKEIANKNSINHIKKNNNQKVFKVLSDTLKALKEKRP